MFRHHIEELKWKAIQERMGYQQIKRAIQIMNREKEIYGPEARELERKDVRLEAILTRSDVKTLEECIASFHNKNFSDPSSPILVVDQLWIWTFEGTDFRKTQRRL